MLNFRAYCSPAKFRRMNYFTNTKVVFNRENLPLRIFQEVRYFILSMWCLLIGSNPSTLSRLVPKFFPHCHSLAIGEGFRSQTPTPSRRRPKTAPIALPYISALTSSHGERMQLSEVRYIVSYAATCVSTTYMCMECSMNNQIQFLNPVILIGQIKCHNSGNFRVTYFRAFKFRCNFLFVVFKRL